MAHIKGVPVTVYDYVQTGTDAFNAPVYEEIPTTVDNVLITPTSDADVINDIQLYGKKSVYTLSIPKGDTRDWTDCIVEFWGHKYKVLGFTSEYIESMVPLDWNKKVKVERYG